MKEKEERYRELVAKTEQSYPIFDSSQTPDTKKLYRYKECREINLWTYWQGRGNLNPKVLLVGQDWGNPWEDACGALMKKVRKAGPGPLADYMEGNENPTDRNLRKLFLEIGYTIERPCKDLFFTNFVPGYRAGRISGGFHASWAREAAPYFKELAEILEPRVILCLGKDTFRAVMHTLAPDRKLRIGRYNTFIESDGNPQKISLNGGADTCVFALAHCGVMGTMNRSRGTKADGLELQKQDWRRIRPYLFRQEGQKRNKEQGN